MLKTKFIHFMGAPRVGKTTIINEMKKRYCLPTILDLGLKGRNLKGCETEASIQFELLDEYLSEEKKLLKTKPEMIITDRCLVDQYVFTNFNKIKDDELLKLYGEHILKRRDNSHVYILVFPFDRKAKDYIWQQTLTDIFYESYMLFRYNLHIITTPNLQKRFELVNDIILEVKGDEYLSNRIQNS